eukprot:7309208-Prymnesium_polylepis.1
MARSSTCPRTVCPPGISLRAGRLRSQTRCGCCGRSVARRTRTPNRRDAFATMARCRKRLRRATARSSRPSRQPCGTPPSSCSRRAAAWLA